ncbi:hypothetical protein D3C77_606250 [compost metagenome]
MEFPDHFRKKAGPDHRRQADADMTLFQIAKIIQLRAQALKRGYNMLSLPYDNLPGVGQLHLFAHPVK